MMEIKKRDYLIASIYVAIPGILASIISFAFPMLDALFLALLFGIVFGCAAPSKEVKEIAEDLLSITLPAGIVLYGFKARIPAPVSFKVAGLATFSAFIMGLMVYTATRMLKVNSKLSILLACGTAICGASAITVLSSIVKPKKEDFSAAILVITIVGLTGVIMYPALRQMLGLTPEKYAILSGATLHQTGLVETATRPYGDTVLSVALSVKGIRIALISVAALIASFLYSEKRFYVPWYILAFLIVAMMASFMLPTYVVKLMEPLSTIAFSITLASIGLSVRVSDVQNAGISPLLASYIGWVFGLIIFIALFLLFA